MPLYEYQCDACGARFEIIQKFSDPPAQTCTVCGQGPVKKLLSSPAIQFKGSGWYITDYARKNTTNGGTAQGGSTVSSSTESKGGESGGEKAKSDSAPPPASGKTS